MCSSVSDEEESEECLSASSSDAQSSGSEDEGCLSRSSEDEEEILSQECGTGGATLSLDETDLGVCRKRKSVTTQDKGKVRKLRNSTCSGYTLAYGGPRSTMCVLLHIIRSYDYKTQLRNDKWMSST